MQVNIKDRQEVEATVEVTVPANEVDGAFTSVLRELSGQVRIPGFRPGKVPPAMLEKRVGTEALAKEVKDRLIDSLYREALEEAELNPVSVHFHAEDPERGSEYKFDIHIDLAPEFSLPDLEQIVIDTPETEIGEAEIEGATDRLREENATLLPVEREVQAGDVLTLETLPEGDEEEQGSTMPVDMNAVSPHLAEQLLGLKAGDTVELDLNNPETAEEEEQEASEADGDEESVEVDEDVAAEASGEADEELLSTLKVRVSDVREKELPEADDEFAKTLGFENWDEARAFIEKSLKEQAEAETLEARKEEFVNKILAETPFPVPRDMLNRRRQYLLSNLQNDLAARGVTMEDYVKRLEEREELETFEKDLTESATEAVRRDLVLERLMLDRQTVFTDEEFQEAVEEAAAEEGTSAAALRRERGEEWERNYRFLLQREKALEDAVRENLAAAAVAALG